MNSRAALAVITIAIVSLAPSHAQRSAAQAGTAIIRGQVLAADTGRPLGRVRITLTVAELRGPVRTVVTDADGRYEIKDIARGRYTITAARDGFLSVQYGQRRPREQGTPLDVGDRQVVENVDFLIPRTSVIAGHITN